MKGSKFLIIGGLVVAGVVAYGLYKHYHSIKDTCEANPKNEDHISPIRKDNAVGYSSAATTPDVFEAKETVVASVKERHYEAAKVMEESLNTILKEDDGETIISENSDTLNQTSSDLEDLLK